MSELAWCGAGAAVAVLLFMRSNVRLLRAAEKWQAAAEHEMHARQAAEDDAKRVRRDLAATRRLLVVAEQQRQALRKTSLLQPLTDKEADAIMQMLEDEKRGES